jgi:predicted O-methyltransferase YrrM
MLPSIYACQPSYGNGLKKSKRKFFCGAVLPGTRFAEHPLSLEDEGSSLLADAFNFHWKTALNMQLAGQGVGYFAMLHDDVVPEDGWLGKLLEELEDTGADLVAGVIAIKDARGLTSTAVDDFADPWEVFRRLTMHEVMQLPETFDAADCAEAGLSGGLVRGLLVNTGMWVCRFDRPWRHRVHFQIHNRVVFVSGKDQGELRFGDIVPNSEYQEGMVGAFANQVMSEDWDFSRQLNRFGCDVRATRRVKAEHPGQFPYPNWADVGQWRHDAALRKKWDPAWKDIPHGVRGWLSEEEGRGLARLARGAKVLEIGSYCGLSTVWMGRAAESVHCVDTFDGRGTPRPEDTYQEFLSNIRKFGLDSKVTCWVGSTADYSVSGYPSHELYNLVFVDGAHDEASVEQDADLALSLLSNGGRIAFHDYETNVEAHAGVRKVVDRLVRGGAEIVERIGSTAVVDPVYYRRFDAGAESTGRGSSGARQADEAAASGRR